MRAMIMSAGVGSRLRPVTDLLPKPMAPIVNRPALYHILRLLHRHGLREVVINLHHLPEVIKDYLGDGGHLGMDIRYSFERDLLGTAGGVKKNADFLGEGTFLVMSGDALTDFDLTNLVAQHRRNGSIATMAVKEVADPTEFGVVVADDKGRVLGFQEKPTLEEARSRMCNCGIYVFEPEIMSHIPEGQFDDFGKRLFPDLLKQGVPFHAHAASGYWNDVGNLREYLRGNADALAGRVSVEVPGVEVRPGVWVEEEHSLPESLYIEPPMAIGRGCKIGEGVVLEGPAVIGDGCVIEAGAHVARALLLPGSHVPAGGIIVHGVVGQKTAGHA
jgi:NDP-sugar pyrophosphorylase family protein